MSVTIVPIPPEAAMVTAGRPPVVAGGLVADASPASIATAADPPAEQGGVFDGAPRPGSPVFDDDVFDCGGIGASLVADPSPISVSVTPDP